MKSKITFVLLLLSLFIPHLVTSKVDNLTILIEDNTKLKLSYQPNFLKFDTIIFENKNYLLPIFNEPTEWFRTTDGNIICVTSKLLGVPGIDLYHTEKSISNNNFTFSGNIPNPEIFDILFYQNDNSRKLQTVQIQENSWSFIQYLGIGRNIHIASLNIIVAKYSPETNTITIPFNIEIEISFFPKFQKSTSQIIQDVINPNQAKSWIVENTNVVSQTKPENSILSQSKTLLKIKVDKEGIYRIDASNLSSLGITIPPHLVNTIKLFGGDGKPITEPPTNPNNNSINQIPIIVRTKPNGDLDYILFYGIGTKGFEFKKGTFINYHNQYSNSNYYLLSWEGDPGLRIQQSADITCTNPIIPQFYTERIFYREEITNPFSSGSGNIWFGASIFPRYFTNHLSDLYKNGEISYRFYVAQNYTDVVDNLYGQFSFYEGQNLIGEVHIPRCVTYEEAKARQYEAKLSANTIASDNRSYIRIEYKPPIGATGSATPYFNWYEIHYPRQFKASDKSIAFYTEPNYFGCYEFQISGFEGEIIGLDVSQPSQPKLLTNKSVVLNNFLFRTNIDSGNVRRFIISSNFLKPEIEKIEIPGLKTNPLNSEVVVITHKSLLNSANKYKEFREKTTNYKITIVNIDDIYNEYSCGIPDPMALRFFLADALLNWNIKPLYVILWGDGHYDFRNISTKKVNYIPAFQVADNTQSFTSTVSYTSDDFYAFLVGNDWVIDLIIARVPIYDDQTGLLYVSKLASYENSQEKSKWRSTVLFSADDSPQSKNSYDGNLHTRDSELISNFNVPQDILIKKIYLAEYPTENIPGGRRKPLATADLVRSINDGTTLLNWLGHGNPRVWAHEELFDRDQTISLLSNKDKLFVGIAATCDFGRFDLTEIRSGTEELLFHKNGGAVAFYSATRAVYTTDNKIFNERIVQELFKRNKNGNYQTLGEAYFNVKSISIGDNHRKYLLFGDPLIKLTIPENIAKITKINEFNISKLPKDSIVNINAYSILKLEGEILSPNDSSRISNFSGTVEIVINDVGYTKVVNDIDNTKHSIYKEGGIIAKGIIPVTNGSFSGEFFVTDELSFLNGNLSIRLYAQDTLKNYFAKGYENRIKVSGIDTSNTIFDTEPPIINVFLDDTTFKNGDVVSNPPTLIVKLYDNTVINTTGVGIGHLIEAWIDDNPESIDLTNYYESSLTNPREGIVKRMLSPLKPGSHKIKVRAWDIFNNFSISYAYFNILDLSAGIILTNPIVKPNPAINFVTFRVQHNINEPYSVNLRIFNNFGQKIFESMQDLNKLMNFEINYDCVDEAGTNIPPGIYFYLITVQTKSKKAHISGKFAIVR